MSVKQDSVSIQNDETSCNIQVLRGRTGSIIKVLSDRTAVFRDMVYGDVTFTEDEVKFSVEQKGNDFRSYFPVGRVVYFDIEVDDVRNVKCIRIWVSRKQESDLRSSEPVSFTHQTANLIARKVYKGTVIKMLYPFAFVVEVDDSKIPVFVFNQAFKPNRHAAKLRRDEPISLYVSKGDTVYVKAYRNSPGKKWEWSAWDAWMEDSNTSEPSTSSEDSSCKKTKKRQRKRTRKTKERTCIMKGKLGFVGSEAAHLVSTECNNTVFFHRDNTFLFGVPMKGLRLDEIFKTGEELSFLLSEDIESEASCVWFGSHDTVSLNLRERTNSIIKYFRERGIDDPSLLTAIVQKLGRQRLPGEGKQEFEDEEEEMYDSCKNRVLAAGSISHKELNDSTRSKSDVNQVDSYGTAEQSTLSAATATSNIVPASILNISTVTAATKEKGSTAIPKQNMTASEEISCIVTTKSSTTTVTASEQSIDIATATAKQSDSTVTTTSTAVARFANENSINVTATSKTFFDSTEDAKIITNSLEPNSKVKTDSLKDNSNTASETENQTNKAHCEVEYSTAASISEHIDSLDDHRHVDLRKIHSRPRVSDTETEMLYGTESGFHVSVINTDVEYNLKLSLLSVLEKEVGESASQILAPYVIELFKKELNCMVQEFMMKALSSVIDNVTEQCDQDADSHCEGATGVTKISNMVQEWKKEMILIADKQKAEKKMEMTALLDRAQKYRERMTVLYHSDMASSQSNCEESNANSCNINNGDRNESYSNDGINFIPDDYDDGTEEKSTLVGIVQDFMQLQNVTDSQMVGTQKCVSDQGTQTVSTGCILYLRCLPDL